MPGSDNLDDVAGWIDQVVASISFDLPGADQSLGRDLVGTVAMGIQQRSVPDALDPGGGSWPANEARYAAYKARRYSAFQPGILSGQMLSLASLKGESTIGPESVEMRYGLGVPADRSATGATLPRSYTATDREKAAHFSESRPFYALDGTIAEACVRECEQAIDRMLG